MDRPGIPDSGQQLLYLRRIYGSLRYSALRHCILRHTRQTMRSPANTVESSSTEFGANLNVYACQSTELWTHLPARNNRLPEGHSPQSCGLDATYWAGSIVLMVAYGYSTINRDNELVKLVNEAMDQSVEMTAINAFTVDIFPISRFDLEWFPGAAWQNKVFKHLEIHGGYPASMSSGQMTAGTSLPCFISGLLHENTKTPEEVPIIK
ncbi:hypothetical protein C8J56DRAFT_1092391 [Mycena floridula]|nr:hypothetical protein C8J56DRAFT_1092391 [Mycena floridula]